MQFLPDSSRWYTLANLEAYKFGQHVKFAGPGLYLTKTETLLVVPCPPNRASTSKDVWDSYQPEGTLYEVHVWNCEYHETLISALCNIPTRDDKR